MTDFITIKAQETTTSDKQYIGPGRPGPNRPYKRVGKRHVQLSCQRNQTALNQALQLAACLLQAGVAYLRHQHPNRQNVAGSGHGLLS